jgi:hypothetical protein
MFDDPGGLVGSLKGKLVTATNACCGGEVRSYNEAIAYEIGQDIVWSLRDLNNC